MSRWDWSQAAPETERTWSSLSPEVLASIAGSDEQALREQRSRVSPTVAPKITEATYTLRNRFRYWEQLVRAMAAQWAPTGRCIVDDYTNNLDSRDSIDRVLAELPGEVATALGPLLGEFDRRFHELTEPDDGEALRPWDWRLRRGEPMSHRWYRAPRTIPWN